VIEMAKKYSADDVIDILIGIGMGGRGGGVNPENPMLGIPSFGEAVEEDRRRQQVNGGGGGFGGGGGGASSARGAAISSMNTSVDNMLRALRGDFDTQRRSTKRKKKVSRYSRCVGKHLKALKKKHPRTKQTALLKRAHAACKKQRKREGW